MPFRTQQSYICTLLCVSVSSAGLRSQTELPFQGAPAQWHQLQLERLQLGQWNQLQLIRLYLKRLYREGLHREGLHREGLQHKVALQTPRRVCPFYITTLSLRSVLHASHVLARVGLLRYVTDCHEVLARLLCLARVCATAAAACLTPVSHACSKRA